MHSTIVRSKKRVNRGVWNIKINAAVRDFGMSYSRFIDALKKNNVAIDRKILSQLAQHHKTIFAKVVDSVKSAK
jgi:large subunit ribosomal protein L20